MIARVNDVIAAVTDVSCRRLGWFRVLRRKLGSRSDLID